MNWIKRFALALVGLVAAAVPAVAVTSPANAVNCPHLTTIAGDSWNSSRYHTYGTNTGVTVKANAYDDARAPSGSYFTRVYVHSGYDVTMYQHYDGQFAKYTSTGWHSWGNFCTTDNWGSSYEG